MRVIIKHGILSEKPTRTQQHPDKKGVEKYHGNNKLWGGWLRRSIRNNKKSSTGLACFG